MMEQYIRALQEHAQSHRPDFGDGESVLTLLYEAYSDNNRMDNAQIKADFKELYRQMEGMELREMDQIIDPVCILCRDHERSGFVEGDPVCILCRDHERSGFVEGVKVGVMLAEELKE